LVLQLEWHHWSLYNSDVVRSAESFSAIKKIPSILKDEKLNVTEKHKLQMLENEVYRKLVVGKIVKNSRYDAVVLPRKPRLAGIEIK
jgi:hypothetical protein